MNNIIEKDIFFNSAKKKYKPASINEEDFNLIANEAFLDIKETFLDIKKNNAYEQIDIYNKLLKREFLKNFRKKYQEFIKKHKGEKLDKEFFTAEEQETIARENMKLVHHVVGKFVNKTNTPDNELFSVGLMGFTKAIQKFDKSRNINFSTFAVTCIKNEIIGFLSGRQNVDDDKQKTSLDFILNESTNGEHLTVAKTLEDKTKNIENDMIRNEYHSFMLKAIDSLEEVESIILKKVYGVSGFEKKYKKDIAFELGITPAEVTKIEKIALSKLSKIFKEKGYEQYV